jgi:hypothetical protein
MRRNFSLWSSFFCFPRCNDGAHGALTDELRCPAPTSPIPGDPFATGTFFSYE